MQGLVAPAAPRGDPSLPLISRCGRAPLRLLPDGTTPLAPADELPASTAAVGGQLRAACAPVGAVGCLAVTALPRTISPRAVCSPMLNERRGREGDTGAVCPPRMPPSPPPRQDPKGSVSPGHACPRPGARECAAPSGRWGHVPPPLPLRAAARSAQAGASAADAAATGGCRHSRRHCRHPCRDTRRGRLRRGHHMAVREVEPPRVGGGGAGAGASWMSTNALVGRTIGG